MLNRRWILIRAAVWIAIVVYAVMVIRDPHFGDGAGRAVLETAGVLEPPQDWLEVARPAEIEVPPARGDLADAVLRWPTHGGCPAPGSRLRVTMGPGGIVKAEATGFSAGQACFATRVWTMPWPAMAGGGEVELAGE
jgi:hypothetical protein